MVNNILGKAWSSEGDLITQLQKKCGTEKLIAIMKNYREKSISLSDISSLKTTSYIRLSLGWWIFAFPFKVGAGSFYKLIKDPYYNGTVGLDGKLKQLVYQLSGGLSWIYNNLCKWAHQNGKKIIIDIHSAPGGSAHGVSFAGLPINSVSNSSFLKPQLFTPGDEGKAVRDYFITKIVTNALDFIDTVNTKYPDLICAFEPMNEPGNGYYSVNTSNWKINNKPSPANARLASPNGSAWDIYNVYSQCIQLFDQYRRSAASKKSFAKVKFWMQLYINPYAAAFGFIALTGTSPHVTPGPTSWEQALDVFVGKKTEAYPGTHYHTGPTNFLLQATRDYYWPDWLMIDSHWYQTWAISICKNESPTNSTVNNQHWCWGGEGGWALKSFCNPSLRPPGMSKTLPPGRKTFNDWLDNIVKLEFHNLWSWFTNFSSSQKSTNRPAPTSLENFVACSEWSIATTPPSKPYQQCTDQNILNYFFQQQRQLYEKWGIINCYWTLKCPQAGLIQQPWSYQYMISNNLFKESTPHSTAGVAIGNIFNLEDWFFDGSKIGPSSLPPKFQAGGATINGNASGALIPRPKKVSTYKQCSYLPTPGPGPSPSPTPTPGPGPGPGPTPSPKKGLSIWIIVGIIIGVVIILSIIVAIIVVKKKKIIKDFLNVKKSLYN